MGSRLAGEETNLRRFLRSSPAASSSSPPSPSPEVVRSLKLGNVWVFVQLICRQARTENHLKKTQTLLNLRLLTTSGPHSPPLTRRVFLAPVVIHRARFWLVESVARPTLSLAAHRKGKKDTARALRRRVYDIVSRAKSIPQSHDL